MSLRPAALLLCLALTAAACAGGPEASDLAEGGPSAGPAQPATEQADTERAGTEQADTEAGTGDTAATSDAEATGAAAEGPAVEALWWTAQTLDGEEFVAADLAGQNVVLWMWAPWCSVCNREAPEVAEALAELPDDVTIVGVAGRDDVAPMRDFVAAHGLGAITHVVDADGSLWGSYGISYQPAWVFIDAEGRASVAAGMLGRDGLLAGIDEVFRG